MVSAGGKLKVLAKALASAPVKATADAGVVYWGAAADADLQVRGMRCGQCCGTLVLHDCGALAAVAGSRAVCVANQRAVPLQPGVEWPARRGVHAAGFRLQTTPLLQAVAPCAPACLCAAVHDCQALKATGVKVLSWEELVTTGKEAAEAVPVKPAAGDLCTIMYTSGEAAGQAASRAHTGFRARRQRAVGR